MYKITLYNENIPTIVSGVFCIYCDDIEEFEKEWIKLEKDKNTINRFRRSKAGEMVTDYYSDLPELNIVQKDKNAELFFEKSVVIFKKDVEVFNGYRWPTDMYFERGDFQIRYVKLWGEYLRLVKYKLTGVCRDNWLGEGKCEATCWGNPVLKNHIAFRGDSENIADFSDNTIESIAYYPLGTYETEEEMKKDYEDMGEDFFTEEELDELFSDIVGEAG